ncbi:hypothetical protein HK096_000866 [Nowakowskiella sp. JEL0078]|nr:hypothetical protein HK096_000866 [Nowakowskiella sp. JEL0078]
MKYGIEGFHSKNILRAIQMLEAGSGTSTIKQESLAPNTQIHQKAIVEFNGDRNMILDLKEVDSGEKTLDKSFV